MNSGSVRAVKPISPFTKQNGVTLMLTMVFIVGIFAAIGMGTDTGHWLVNKTRLQNALDATALSAAMAINADVNRNTDNATTAGKDTYKTFLKGDGNKELGGLSPDSLTFQYSKTLNPWVAGSAPPYFVRVSANALAVSPIFIQVLPNWANPINISAVSTAGAVGTNCKLAPLIICPSGGSTVCNETSCNGVPYNTRVCLKGGTGTHRTGSCQNTALPNGNFGLLRFDGMAGGDDIKALLAGTVDTCSNVAGWENGNKVGPVSDGIDGRFDDDKVWTEYGPPDGWDGSSATNLYQQYDARYNANSPSWDNANGISRNRVIQVPVTNDCGSATVTINKTACFFMTERAVHTGGDNEIYGELLNSCPGVGKFSPANSTLYGPYKVVLFKSAGSNDS